MCHAHVGLTASLGRARIKDRFPKPVYAPQDKELLDNNSELVTPRKMLVRSLKMIVEGFNTGSATLAFTGLYTAGPAGSAIYDEWRVKNGIDLGTNRYIRSLTVPLPSLVKPTEGSFLPFEFNRDYRKDYKASAELSNTLRNARRVFPTHLVQEVLNDQCNHLYNRTVQVTQAGDSEAAALFMDHMEGVAALAAEHDPATAAEDRAAHLREIPKPDKPFLKESFQNVLDMEPDLPALNFIIKPVFNRILKPIFKLIPGSSYPAVTDEKRAALNEVIGLYMDTAYRIRQKSDTSGFQSQ